MTKILINKYGHLCDVYLGGLRAIIKNQGRKRPLDTPKRMIEREKES